MHLFFGVDLGLPCLPKHLPTLATYPRNKVMPSTCNTRGKSYKVKVVPDTPASIPVPR